MAKFRDWITSQGGVVAVAHSLKIGRHTVYAWLDGRASPKALMMQKIVRLSKGAVSYDDIINETKKQPAVKTAPRIEL